jgi:MFS transporter, DHA2 family, multidrug resistance protein
MASPPADSAPVSPIAQSARWTLVLAVVLTAVLEVLDSTIVNVALPHMQAAFGIASDQTTWILTSYIVSSVVVMPLTGFFSRRFGRRRLITTAILGFATFSALCGLAQSIEMMVTCRVGQGLFGAFLIPLSQSILFDTFPIEKRGQSMALFGLGVIVAPILGPTVGAILTEYFSWRAVFYVNLPVAAFALMMISGELKRDETQRIKVDWVGLALMVTAVGMLQFMLDQGQSRDWFSDHGIQVAAFLSFASAVAFFICGWNFPGNIIDFSLLRDRSFASANIAMIGIGLAMYGAIAMLPLFVQGLLNYPVLDAGYLFMPRGLAAGFSMVVTGAVLVRHFDQRLLVAIGLTMTGFGNMMLGWLNLNAGFWDLAWPGVISGLGMGLFFVPLSTLAFQHIENRKQDEASGIYGVMRSLGSSVGIAIVGWQYAQRLQFHWNALAAGITPFNGAARTYVQQLQLLPGSVQAAEEIAAQVAQQAAMLAFQDAFILSGYAAFLMLPIILLIDGPQRGVSPSIPAH